MQRKYDTLYVREAICRLKRGFEGLNEVLGSHPVVQKTCDRIVQDIIKGHFQQTAKMAQKTIEAVVVKLSDESICFDIATFAAVLEKKYNELFRAISFTIQEAAVSSLAGRL